MLCSFLDTMLRSGIRQVKFTFYYCAHVTGIAIFAYYLCFQVRDCASCLCCILCIPVTSTVVNYSFSHLLLFGTELRTSLFLGLPHCYCFNYVFQSTLVSVLAVISYSEFYVTCPYLTIIIQTHLCFSLIEWELRFFIHVILYYCWLYWVVFYYVRHWT